MLRTVAVGALVASAAAFAPAGISTLPSSRAGATCTRMQFGQQADSSAPPADLFNIWRNDYMLSTKQAASEAAEREANTIFDGVLPPFSNVVADAPSLRGLGAAADFSTANPTSAYDTATFGSVYLPNKDVLKNPKTGAGPEVEYLKKVGQKGGTQRAAPAGTQRAPQKRGGFFGRK